MEVEIDFKSLIDSPLSDTEINDFSSDQSVIDDFVNHLISGRPTCYLVSGYRGVGKTSLVKNLEASVKKDDQDKESVFVYTNFGQYGEKTHVIRKLIRELYLSIEKNERYQTLEKGTPFKRKFEVLYQQTFKEVSEITDNSSSRERAIISEFSMMDAIKGIGKQLLPIVGLIWLYISSRFKQGLVSALEWLAPIILGIWTIVNIIRTQISFASKTQSSNSLYTKTLFDDEIAETHLFDVLRSLNALKFRVIFVIDELDKLNPQDLTSLMTEIKPYLICGYASFIVVGGQNLFYKYDKDDNIDDSVLSTLFAKVYHVSLTSSADLKDRFYRKIVKVDSLEQLDEAGRKELEAVLDYIVVISRLIPRRFIMKLKQNIIWKEKKAYLTGGIVKYNRIRWGTVINAIDKIDDQKISPTYSKAIRDFIITRMYIRCHATLTKGGSITKETFING